MITMHSVTPDAYSDEALTRQVSMAMGETGPGSTGTGPDFSLTAQVDEDYAEAQTGQAEAGGLVWPALLLLVLLELL